MSEEEDMKNLVLDELREGLKVMLPCKLNKTTYSNIRTFVQDKLMHRMREENLNLLPKLHKHILVYKGRDKHEVVVEFSDELKRALEGHRERI